MQPSLPTYGRGLNALPRQLLKKSGPKNFPIPMKERWKRPHGFLNSMKAERRNGMRLSIKEYWDRITEKMKQDGKRHEYHYRR